MSVREIQAVESFAGPACRCGSRNTKRLAYLERYCHSCHQTYHYRLRDGLLVPLTRIAALALDARRANGERP